MSIFFIVCFFICFSPFLFAVLPVTDGLVIHLDASQITGVADGAPIATWSDLSGLGNDALQTLADAQPTYVTASPDVNDLASVRFDGVDDWVDLADVVDVNSFTLFLVGKFNSIGGDQYFISGQSGDPVLDNRVRIAQYDWSTQFRFRAGTTDYSTPEKNTAAHTFGLNSVSDAWLDGSFVDGQTNTASGLTPALSLGSYKEGSSGFLNGDIAEVVLYNRVLDAAEVAQVSAELNTKYATAQSTNTQSSITVDYAVDLGASNQVASGLLHGISADHPAQYLIDGIKVNAVRGADYYGYLPNCYEADTYNRIKATGADLMIGLYYRAKESGYWPGDGGDWQTWRDICTDIYNEAQTNNYDIYSWIPWNEPRLQWGNLNTYKRAHKEAYQTIKALNPAARIQAPEDHAYSLSFLSDFLTYCRDNGCLPDILAWHELSQDPLDVEAHCSEIKSWMQNNGITPMPIAVTEYQGGSYSNDNTSIPGVNVYYLASMERAVQHGFAFGLHACWSWSGSDSNFIATLADMANKDGANLPRGLWWNYNAYKDMTGRKVQVGISGSNGDAFASLDNDMNRSIILIGTKNYTTYHDVSLNLNNIPDSLTYNGKIHIRAEMIRDEMVLMSPEVMVAGDYSISGGAVVLDLPTLDPKASYMVYVSPATSDAPATSYESEALSATFTAGRTHRVFDEAAASGGQTTILEATADGDYVEYQIPSPGEGVYNLSAILESMDDHGFMQLYINGQSMCPPEDQYSDTEGYYANDFGNIYVGSGDLYLKFVVVGQNPSSQGKWIVFDRFDLTKLSSQIFEPTNCQDVQSLGYRLDEDLNGDCQIGIADLMLLTDQWLSSSPVAVPPNYSPDIVADNEINLADFTAMANQWLVCNDPATVGCIENW